MATSRKKDSINATVSPSLRKRVEEVVDNKEFSSLSDVVSQALTQFFEKRDAGKSIKNIASKRVVHEHRETDQFEREIWKHKGLTLQKMGRLEEAIECFDMALGVELYKEKGECMKTICPEPRELTLEEEIKAAEAKEYYRTLLGEEKKEETVSEQPKKR